MRTSSLQMASEAVPHGGKLVNTMIKDNQAKNDAMSACNFAVELDERQLCDVELLMQGESRYLESLISTNLNKLTEGI
jgi:ATP sulfurylase